MSDHYLAAAARIAFVGALSAQLVAALRLHIAPTARAALLVSVGYWLVAETMCRTRAAARLAASADDRRTSMTLQATLAALAVAPLITLTLGAVLPFALPALHDSASVAAWGPPMALALLGVGLRLWAMATLQDSFSRTLAVRAGQTTIVTGPYAFVRHPGYLANGVVLVCTTLVASANGALAAACAATFAAAWHRRIAAEEALLSRELPAYRAYTKLVRYRLVPGLY